MQFERDNTTMTSLVNWAREMPEDFIAKMLARAPDVMIGGSTEEDVYMKRWWVYPRSTSLSNVYFHQFMRSDDDRALHDHPFDSTSIILRGEYTEVVPLNQGIKDGPQERYVRRAGDIISRVSTDAHRVELHAGTCFTLFLTGPNVKEWGFYCGGRWVPWKTFTGYDHNAPGAVRPKVSPGCGEP